MNVTALKEYRRLRALGWRAVNAIRAARIYEAWIEAEADGLVELRCESDDFPFNEPDYDSVYERKCDADLARKEDRELIAREGIQLYSAWWRLSEDDPWEGADSCGGFMGEANFQDSGYDVDLRRSALVALRGAQLKARHETFNVESAVASQW